MPDGIRLIDAAIHGLALNTWRRHRHWIMPQLCCLVTHVSYWLNNLPVRETFLASLVFAFAVSALYPAPPEENTA